MLISTETQFSPMNVNISTDNLMGTSVSIKNNMLKELGVLSTLSDDLDSISSTDMIAHNHL